jgi:FAD/FMN-containing dehydrogenase
MPSVPPQTGEGLSRRELLRRAGGLAAGVAVAPWWRLASSGLDRDARVKELAGLLKGDVVGRADPGYASARLLFDTTFDGVRPLAVAYCQGSGDVGRTLAWAKKHGIRVAPRSGGHSYGGYSTTPGVIIDVGRLNGVSVHGARAVVGAGARLVDVYEGLGSKGLAIPAGSCATVGISGLALGGGQGFLGRKWGLTADNVLELELVTAGGTRLVCSPSEHADLYWACRGGGGGNFGIVTRWTFRAHPITTVSTFHIDWPFDQLPAVLDAWQHFAPHAPDELVSILSLSGSGGVGRVAAVGQLIGSKVELDSLLGPLASTGTPTRVATILRPYLDAVRMWAGCSALDSCHLGPAGELQRATFAAKSDYARKPLPPAAVTVIANALKAAPARGLLLLDSYGGAINRVPKAATAFVHRDMLFSFQYLAYWTGAAPTAANRTWLRAFHAAMRPYVSGEAYQNYIDPELTTWRDAYYGSNYKRLVAVKKRYDPTNVFRFAQGVG